VQLTIEIRIMTQDLKPIVSIIMGSTSDLAVMTGAAEVLNQLGIPFEMNALSAHRTPDAVEKFAKGAQSRGIKVIIAAAGMAAHLPGVIAAMTPLPVIGVPIKASLEGMDSILAILQMPPGIPVATVALNGSRNSAILAAQMIATGDALLMAKLIDFKEDLKIKIVEANNELAQVKYPFKTN
jgi:5-(carboxyamino)imidazole ribonucleotide mutase